MPSRSLGRSVHRILALAVLGVAILSSIRLSFLGLGDAWNMLTDPVVREMVPNAWMGGLVKVLAHGLVIGWCIITAIGTLLRKRWGFLFAIGLLPVRVIWVVSILKVGELLGLNLWRIEHSIVETSLFLAILLLPLLLVGRNMRDFYGIPAPVRLEPETPPAETP